MSGTGNPGSGAPSSAPAPSSPAAPSSPSPAPASPAPTSPPPSGAPGGGSAPGGSPAGPTRQEQMGVPNEVIAVLGYDPFGPPAEDAPPQPPPAQPVAQPPQPGQPAQPAQPAVPPNELEALKQQLGTVTQQLQQLRQPAQPAQPAPGQPGHPAGPIDPVPTYQYEIPDQVLQLMASENPADRKLALGNVMTAVSRSVHGLMQKELAQVIPALARQVMMEHLGQQEVGKDFYSTYKDLDKPHLRPLIYQIAAGWAQQNPQAGWNAETRDAIARIVYQTFNMQFPGGAPPAQHQPQPPAAPVMMPTMTRPAVSHMATEQEEMMDLLR